MGRITEKLITIIGVSITTLAILYYVGGYFIWLRKHKKSMKKFRKDLEESKWRKENWNKSVDPTHRAI